MTDIDNDDIRRLDGGLLLIFRELVRHRRQTAVAAHLGISQSAVSHALARLRDIFDDPLFRRLPNGLEPTRRALELAPRVDALIDLMGGMTRADGFDPARSERRFYIGATEFAVGLIDPAFVTELQKQAPKVTFALQHLRGHVALSALGRGQLDLAIGRFEAPSPGLLSTPLYADSYCTVARQGHPTIRGHIDMATWAQTGHIFVSAYNAFDDVLGPSVGEDRMPDSREANTTAIVPRWEMALSLVASSNTIADCPRRFAEQQSALLGLQALEPPYDVPGWVLTMTRREEPDAGLDWLCGMLTAAASRNLPADTPLL
jgi:DNA-binding transcriptional LysR family regulator